MAEAATLPTPTEVVSIDDLITQDAAKYGVSREKLDSVIRCESDYNVHAISSTGDYGIAQWNLKAHPEITKELAFDPVWSINEMSLYFSEGKAKQWVCYQKLYM